MCPPPALQDAPDAGLNLQVLISRTLPLVWDALTAMISCGCTLHSKMHPAAGPELQSFDGVAGLPVWETGAAHLSSSRFCPC